MTAPPTSISSLNARYASLLDSIDDEIHAWNGTKVTRGVDRAVATLSFWSEAAASVRIEGEDGNIESLATHRKNRHGDLEDTIRASSNTAGAIAYARSAIEPARPGRTATTDHAFIQDIHTIAMQRLMPEEKLGQWRESEVDIVDHRTGRIANSGAPASRLPATMKEWSDRYQADAWLTSHPVIRAGLAHLSFERIHPFSDGNGRTGRVLLTAMAIEDGLPAVPTAKIFEQHRADYHSSLTDAIKTGRPDRWLDFHIEASFHAMRHLRTMANELDTVSRVYEKAMLEQNVGKDTRHRRAIAGTLIGTPIASDTLISRRSRVDLETIRQATSALRSAGHLTRTETEGVSLYVANAPLELARKPYVYQREPERGLERRSDVRTPGSER